jgi:hypothetical protein
VSNVQLVGVSSTIALHDVKGMTRPEQDQFIKEVATDLHNKLRDMVANCAPASPIAFQVEGPFDDPLQGVIWVHTLAAHFDLDSLPRTCEAIRIELEGTATPTERQRITTVERPKPAPKAVEGGDQS